MSLFGVLEARNNLSGLIKRARAGEEVVIAARGVPQVRLVPVEQGPDVGTPAALLQALAAVPLATSSQRTGHQIEAAIQAERDAWE